MKLVSQYEPAHMVGMLLQKTDGEIHLIRLTANQQARLANLLFNETEGKLPSHGEVTKELLEEYFDGKFVLTKDEE